MSLGCPMTRGGERVCDGGGWREEGGIERYRGLNL